MSFWGFFWHSSARGFSASGVRKGMLTNEEVLEEIKAVRRELERKRGR